MTRKLDTRLLLVLLILSIIPLYRPIVVDSGVTSLPRNPSIHGMNVNDENEFTFTWTSRWQPEPQPVENCTEIVGDHVVLNVTFAEDMNVARTEITLHEGLTFTATSQLVNQSSSMTFPFYFREEDFDWMQISGLKPGWPINFSCDFTNNDTDFYAWPSDFPMYKRDLYNSIVDMASGNKPETASFIWTSDCGSIDIGSYNYFNEPGNWTVNLVAGFEIGANATGRSVILDTYELWKNETVDVTVNGYTSASTVFTYTWSDVTFSNYFIPHVSVNSPIDFGNYQYNFTWTSSDLNADDVNYFDVWFSVDGGISYQLLGRNITQEWFLWDASGFLYRDDCIFRVRAYSVDLLTFPGPFLSIPDDYFPGDYSDGFSPYFDLTGIPTLPQTSPVTTTTNDTTTVPLPTDSPMLVLAVGLSAGMISGIGIIEILRRKGRLKNE